MVEYGLILGLVSVVAVIAVTATGTAVNDFWVAVQGVIEALPIP
jgi:Flp pilus assembly pilin Flp